MRKNGKSKHESRDPNPGQSREPAYPRPRLRRERWVSLDGSWEFHIDPDAALAGPDDVDFDRVIRVPFAPETPASDVEETGMFRAVWYRRSFETPPLADGERLLLHFGAVDYTAEVWVNGRLAVRHEGGYTPFHADVTDLLDTEAGVQTVVVRAEDDPLDLQKPRGKQDWLPDPHSIWYYRTTGIWQSVWLEVVPQTWVQDVRWNPAAPRWEIAVNVRLAGRRRDDLRLRVRLTHGGRVLADDTYAVPANSDEIARRIAVPDPGIDDARGELLWSPERPNLIDAEIELLDAAGATVDAVRSYTAMRHIELLGDRFVLNGKPYVQRLVLNQGYWPDGGLTAPDDDAFRRDIELIKSMGFNGVRMHQKIEDPRFLHWADRLGLLVWEEMPSCYTFGPQTIERLTAQWAEAIRRDLSHPCIVAWVPINESWGVPDLPSDPAQRNAVQALYHLTKTLDPTRPVIGNDGWEAAATDIVAIHDYDHDPRRLACRYGECGSPTGIERVLREERPGHRVLLLTGFPYQNQPVMLTEFGGIAFSERAGTWGYSRATSSDDFRRRYANLLAAVRSLRLAGFCYTQFTDTYQEANGLLYMDRTPKIPLSEIAVATRGPHGPEEEALEAEWRQELREVQQRETRTERRRVRADR